MTREGWWRVTRSDKCARNTSIAHGCPILCFFLCPLICSFFSLHGKATLCYAPINQNFLAATPPSLLHLLIAWYFARAVGFESLRSASTWYVFATCIYSSCAYTNCTSLRFFAQQSCETICLYTTPVFVEEQFLKRSHKFGAAQLLRSTCFRSKDPTRVYKITVWHSGTLQHVLFAQKASLHRNIYVSRHSRLVHSINDCILLHSTDFTHNKTAGR